MLRGEFGSLHFPPGQGERWTVQHVGSRSSNRHASLAIVRHVVQLQGLFQFVYAPGGFSYHSCYDHLLNDPQGSSRCGSAGDGMSLLQELSVVIERGGREGEEGNPVGKVIMGT